MLHLSDTTEKFQTNTINEKKKPEKHFQLKKKNLKTECLDLLMI